MAVGRARIGARTVAWLGPLATPGGPKGSRPGSVARDRRGRMAAKTGRPCPLLKVDAGGLPAPHDHRQPAGRPLRTQRWVRGGKSGLHGDAVPDNLRRGSDPRESATESRPPRKARAGGVRVKGCGKSAPRTRQRGRHGKPHREQDRIGTTRRFAVRPVSRPVVRVGCSRRPATAVPEEWPPRPLAGPTEPGLQAG